MEVTKLLNGSAQNQDYDLNFLIRQLLNEGVIEGLEVTTNSVSAGKGLIEVTRAGSPNQTFYVLFENTSAKVIDTSGTKKVYIEIPQLNVDNSALNTEANGTGVGVITTGASFPADNFIPLASITSGTITDARVFTEVQQASINSSVLSIVTPIFNARNSKNSCLVATTGDITLSGEQTIDGELTDQSRVLVWKNSTQSENGIYVSDPSGWTRAIDFDETAEIPSAVVGVEKGVENKSTLFYCSSNDVTVDSDPIVFFAYPAPDTSLTESTTKTFTAGETLAEGDACFVGRREYYSSLTNIDESSYVDENSSGSNFGSSSSLIVNSTDYTSNKKEAFIRVPSSITTPPANHTNGTKIKLRIFISAMAGGESVIDIDAITSSWTEGAVTWATKPTTQDLGVSFYASSTGWQEIEFEVDSATLTNILTFGVRLNQVHTPTSIDRFVTFDSDDGTNKPQIAISYIDDDTEAWKSNAKSTKSDFTSTGISITKCNAISEAIITASATGTFTLGGYTEAFSPAQGEELFLSNSTSGDIDNIPNTTNGDFNQKLGYEMNGKFFFEPKGRVLMYEPHGSAITINQPQQTGNFNFQQLIYFSPKNVDLIATASATAGTNKNFLAQLSLKGFQSKGVSSSTTAVTGINSYARLTDGEFSWNASFTTRLQMTRESTKKQSFNLKETIDNTDGTFSNGISISLLIEE